MKPLEDMVYGFHAIESILIADPTRIDILYIQHGKLDSRIDKIRSLSSKASIRIDLVGKVRLDQMVDAPHQGVVARCRNLSLFNEDEFESKFSEFDQPKFFLLIDGITDPRNLGACLRSAAAAGVQVVFLPKRRSAPVNALALKTAAGGAEHLMLVEVTNVARRLKWLRDQGVWVIGGCDSSEKHWVESDYSGDLLLAVGSEEKGLRRLTRESCDELVAIPMQGLITSLNVSVATGVLLFEAVRQRTLHS